MQNIELRIVVLSALALLCAGGFTAMLLFTLRKRPQWSSWIIAGGLLTTCGAMVFIDPAAAGIMLLLICAWGAPVLIACQVIVDRNADDQARQVENSLEALREEYRA